MSEAYSAVVAGHVCLDIIPDMAHSVGGQFEATFLPGRLFDVGPAAFSTGGAVSNTGLVLHKLGISTQLMGKVGDDLFGQAVRQIVSAHSPHLAEGMIVDRTGQYVLHSRHQSPRSGPHLSALPRRQRYLPRRRRALRPAGPGAPVPLRLPPPDALDVRSRRRSIGGDSPPCQGNGCHHRRWTWRFPDASSPAGRADWVSILKAALPSVDIFLPSIEETLYMLRRETYRQLCQAAQGGSILPLVSPALLSDLGRELLDMGVKIVGLKLGHRGLYVRTAGRTAVEALGALAPPTRRPGPIKSCGHPVSKWTW